MELVTKDNIDYNRECRLTESGLKLHSECSFNTVLFLERMSEIHGFDNWCIVTCVLNKEKRRLGARLGENGVYDLYYAEDLYSINDIFTNLDKLEDKLK